MLHAAWQYHTRETATHEPATARAAASCVSCEVARVMRVCEFEFEIRIYLYILYE